MYKYNIYFVIHMFYSFQLFKCLLQEHMSWTLNSVVGAHNNTTDTCLFSYSSTCHPLTGKREDERWIIQFHQTLPSAKTYKVKTERKQPIKSLLCLFWGSKIWQYTVQDFDLINHSCVQVKNTVFQEMFIFRWWVFWLFAWFCNKET